MNISGEYSAIFTTYVDGQLYVGEYGVRYKWLLQYGTKQQGTKLTPKTNLLSY